MGTNTTSDTPAESPAEEQPASDGPFDADPVFEIGRVLAGKYRIDGVLGRGGMGVVHAGRQLELDRPVAIKCLRGTSRQGSRASQRFAREARAIAKMRSEHVVRVYDVGVEDGLPFIVMEQLIGVDLGQELERGPLSVETTASYLLQACEAIAEAHALGIVHRDLKPSNLFIAEALGGRRTVKVLDFGVSKWLGPAPDLDTPLATGTHGFIGTPAFMSPEQLTRPEAVDQRTDIWALGVVLHRCLSGSLPFEMDSVPRLCAAILTAEPRSLGPPGTFPIGLRDIVLRCLEKDPERRYESVLELARALAPLAPESERHPLALIERLPRRQKADGETPHVSAPTTATTPTQHQSTTAGFSQDTRPSPELTRERSGLYPLGRRAAPFLIVAGAIAAIAVATTLTRRSDAPPFEPAPQREERSTAVQLGDPVSEPPDLRSLPPRASASHAPLPSSSALPEPSAGPAAAPRRRLSKPPPAAVPSKQPAPPASGPATDPSVQPAAPSAVPRAPSKDEYDRNIYRR